ncbi:MAG TPA: sigma-70 family RNA polymerase sigma factor [Caulobacteraceae bacterium]|jgi:RNA polymerase sigma-70 factor (ECF subfamily)|nr:sigma-70 family RNA polymerase sigma factor [Caulobacteraceae bacterium]
MSLVATYDPALSPAGAARPVVRRGLRQVSDVELRLKALMLLALDGDAAASNALLTALAPPLRRYFARRLGQDAAEVEDLVQETLIAVHTKRHTYDAHQPLTPWVYAIARYRLADHFRRNRRRGETALEDAGQLIAPGDFDAAEARRDLARLLEALPERQRRLVMDVKVEGRSIEETSARTGLSQSAVKVAVHRAVNALAKRFRDANG